MKRAIWWLRRDLRLIDNQALAAALQAADQVIPVFILDPGLLDSDYVGEKRLAFLFDGLRALDGALKQRGSYLVLRRGDPLDELGRLLVNSQAGSISAQGKFAQAKFAQVIYAEADYSPYARRRDARLSAHLPIQWVGSPTLHPPGTVLKADGQPYTVFTPFSKAWKALPAPQVGMRFEPPERIATPAGIQSEPIPNVLALAAVTLFPASEAEAQRRLERFTKAGRDSSSGPTPIQCYADDRDRMDLDGTSQLSPYIRFGMLSARQAVIAAMQAARSDPQAQARQGAQTWLNELVWREFYVHILYHFPRVGAESFRLKGIHWQNNTGHFDAWRLGRTGYPVVDAAMRQLAHSGWMHNRARMIVASFLTKDLLVDWRWGERWFMQHLLDGDPAANNGGWQWSAGTGTDAAPYFRIFNPTTQGKRHDPDGAYIRRWLPELSQVPGEYIHEPWKMPADVQKKAGCRIGVDYPAPLVDHAWARQRALQVYGQAKT